MSDNPYAPPKARVGEPVVRGLSEAPPEARLYTQAQVAVAAFLGSPLAAGWLISRNHRTLARPDQANQALVVGIGATLALFVLRIVLSDRIPLIALSVAGAVACRAWADAQFSTVLQRHRAAGGANYSWWRVVGLSLLCTAIIVVVVFIVLTLLFSFGILVH